LHVAGEPVNVFTSQHCRHAPSDSSRRIAGFARCRVDRAVPHRRNRVVCAVQPIGSICVSNVLGAWCTPLQVAAVRLGVGRTVVPDRRKPDRIRRIPGLPGSMRPLPQPRQSVSVSGVQLAGQHPSVTVPLPPSPYKRSHQASRAPRRLRPTPD
jgi:hypothetical protein